MENEIPENAKLLIDPEIKKKLKKLFIWFLWKFLILLTQIASLRLLPRKNGKIYIFFLRDYKIQP